MLPSLEAKLIAGAVGLLLLLGLFWKTFHDGEKRADDRHAAALLVQQQKNAEATAKLQQQQSKALYDAQLQSDRARAAAAASDRAAASWRVQLDAYRRAHAASPAASSAVQAIPGDDPLGVLADLSGRIDSFAGVVARVAEERRQRAAGCEQSYPVTP